MNEDLIVVLCLGIGLEEYEGLASFEGRKSFESIGLFGAAGDYDNYLGFQISLINLFIGTMS